MLEKDARDGKGKDFNDITSPEIVSMAMNQKDPLCLKVVDKFVHCFGTEAGNLALKTMPYGGIYLLGGVTNGIKDYIINEKAFLNGFYDKGR